MSEKNQENQKSQEELQKEAQEFAEKRRKEWQAFLMNLEENPDEPLTKGELAKALHFIEDDMSGISQMVGMNAQNSQVLNHNLQAIMNA
ncbi:MAG: hypothetical protein ACOC80_11430, partial [Petrotogales bacterium]